MASLKALRIAFTPPRHCGRLRLFSASLRTESHSELFRGVATAELLARRCRWSRKSIDEFSLLFGAPRPRSAIAG
mgnify:CR=1 FL=1